MLRGLHFSVVGKTRPDISKAVLNSWLSHMVTKNRGRDGEPGPDKVASGHLCCGGTREISR